MNGGVTSKGAGSEEGIGNRMAGNGGGLAQRTRVNLSMSRVLSVLLTTSVNAV